MRSWLAIPISGLATAAIGLAVGGIGLGIAAGLAGAAMTAALRALVGESPAALAAAVIASAIMIVVLLDHGVLELRGALAVAALGWTIAELARTTGSSPVVAMLPAVVAGLLDASLVALIPIAGARLVTAPWQRPRWTPLIPVAGVLIAVLAVLACASTTGRLAALGTLWSGRPAAASTPYLLAVGVAEALGPFVVVAAVAGLAGLVGRARYAQVALVTTIAAVLLLDLRAGSVGPSTIAMAALLAGLAIARLAGMIRFPAAQAIVAATVGVLVVVPPAWTAIADRTAGIDARSR